MSSLCKSKLEHINSAFKATGACSHSFPLTGAGTKPAGSNTSLSGENHRSSGFLLLVTDEVEESWTG